MNLKDALPEVFNRIWPALDPETQILLALLLLRSHQIDALPLVIRNKQYNKFVSGYSCLSRLAQIHPEEYGNFFKQSSEDVSIELPTIPAEEGLESLLEAFSKNRFGFAWAEWKGNSEVGGFVSLRDILALYGRSVLSTDLTIGDIASKNIFSLTSNSSLKQALDEMSSRRIRRILVSDTGMIISDRQMIHHVFSPDRLNQIYSTPSALLDGRIGDLEGIEPFKLESSQNVKDAAALLVVSAGCVICESGIVTPWDIILGPWEKKELRIAE